MQASLDLKKRRAVVHLFFQALSWLIPTSTCYILLHNFAVRGIAPMSGYLPEITLIYRIICFVIIIEMLRQYFNDHYIFGTKRITNTNGLISFNTKRTSITYEDVRDVNIAQTLLGRIFDYGTIQLGTAAIDAHEIECKNIGDPKLVAEFVRARMLECKSDSNNNSVYTTSNE